MGEISMIGLDLAKTFIQAHGVDASGKAVLRKQLKRSRLMAEGCADQKP
jgi:hypothetical protein